MHSFLLTIFVFFFLLGAPGLSSALDLGVIGPVYPIAEPHLLDFIRQRLQAMERSGALHQREEQARARGTAAVTQPPPVQGIRAVATARTFYVDPSFTLDHNILDASGKLLFAAGLRKNPLAIVPLSKQLLFFDGRDRRQVTLARDYMTASHHGGMPVKPVLVGGSYLDLMKTWQIPVYYDQHGTLTHRLGITRVPALLSQEGLRLRIDELVLP